MMRLAWKIALTALAWLVATLVVAALLELTGLVTPQRRLPALTAIGAMVFWGPAAYAIWRRRTPLIASSPHAHTTPRAVLPAVLVLLCAGSFFSFWLAAADSREPPFSEGQWRLLGWTLVVAAAVAGWRLYERSK
jgi:drug/metabolite transporter (DMT)-like permease